MRGFTADPDHRSRRSSSRIVFGVGLLYWGNRFKTCAGRRSSCTGSSAGRCWSAAGLVVNHSAGPAASSCRSPRPSSPAFGLFVLAGATPAALGLLADISERFPADRGAIMGLYSVFLAVGQIIGSLIGGFAADWRGIDGMLIATVVLLAVALIPLSRLRARSTRSTPGHPSASLASATA